MLSLQTALDSVLGFLINRILGIGSPRVHSCLYDKYILNYIKLQPKSSQ